MFFSVFLVLFFLHKSYFYNGIYSLLTPENRLHNNILFDFGIGKYVVCKAKGQETDYSSGRGGVQNCIFPFTQHGIRYNGCAPSAEKGKGRLCATEVDSQGNLKKWARCNKYCGNDQGLN